MTVSSNTGRKTFAGDDSTTSFATSPLNFYDDADLDVYVVDDETGEATTLAVGVDFTLSGGEGSTGTLDLSAGSDPYGAPATGTTLLIIRDVARSQPSDYQNNEVNDADVLEKSLDRLTMMMQYQNYAKNRSLRLADSDVSGADTVVPALQASRVLAVNSDGDGLEWVAATSGTLSVSSFMETVLDDVDAAAARTTLGVSASGIGVGTSDSPTFAGLTLTGDINLDGGAGSTYGSSFSLVADTSDASDNMTFTVAGGGAASTSRGAWLTLNGNEASGGGDGSITAGANGDLIFTAGPIVLTVDQTSTVLRVAGGPLSLDSGRIAFPASQTASGDANTLDDYEQGSWTPVLRGAGTAGTQSYTVQVGSYTKIGNSFRLSCFIQINTKDGTTSGNLQVSGVPFQSSGTSNADGTLAVYYSSFDLNAAGGYSQLAATLAAGGSQIILLWECGDNVAAANLTDADFANGSVLKLTGFMEANG